MNRPIMIAFFLGVLLILVADDAEALRCQQRLVTVGASAHVVLQLCGEPAYVVRTVEYRSAYGRHNGHSVEIQIEHWTYDFGPHRFMRQLRFENGILAAVRTLGYGHTKATIRQGLRRSLRCHMSTRSTILGRPMSIQSPRYSM